MLVGKGAWLLWRYLSIKVALAALASGKKEPNTWEARATPARIDFEIGSGSNAAADPAALEIAVVVPLTPPCLIPAKTPAAPARTTPAVPIAAPARSLLLRLSAPFLVFEIPEKMPVKSPVWDKPENAPPIPPVAMFDVGVEGLGISPVLLVKLPFVLNFPYWLWWPFERFNKGS